MIGCFSRQDAKLEVGAHRHPEQMRGKKSFPGRRTIIFPWRPFAFARDTLVRLRLCRTGRFVVSRKNNFEILAAVEQ
jgi:hypothetical protein